MRMAFGLVSLLVVSGILIYLMANNTEKSVKAGKAAQNQIAPLTGRPPSNATSGIPTGNAGSGSSNPGGRAPPSDDPRAAIDKSAEFETHRKGLVVKDVFPGGYFDYYYGLQKGDIVTDAGEATLEGQDVAMLWQMAQQKRDLKVLRNGQSMTLQLRP